MSNLSIGAETESTPLEAAHQPVVLFVDDEANILSTLKRLFRSSGYRLLTAEGGAAALDLLAGEAVDLIISDMRMPGMNGAQFLAQAKQRYPDTLRILLTGYAEMDAAIAAINEGGIYRFLRKPWDEQDLLITVQQALEQKALKQKNAQLAELVQDQNRQLRNFVGELETQVAARTSEIQQTLLFLEHAQEELKRTLMTTLKVFSNMIELRSGMLGGNSNRIAELAQRLGRKFDLAETAVQELKMAGLLHAIGKIGLPDSLIRKPLDRMSTEETLEFFTHARKGQMVLMPVESFAGVGRIIAHQYERFDGRGTPDALDGASIPLGARILAVVRDFEALRSGAMVEKSLADDRVVGLLQAQRGRRYDPLVVDRFVELLSEPDALQPTGTRLISSNELSAGLLLAEDLISREGVLLLTKDSIITPHYMAQIRKFEEIENARLRILIAV